MLDLGVNANLMDARSHERHRLPVVGLQTHLYTMQLMASLRRASSGNSLRSSLAEPTQKRFFMAIGDDTITYI